MIFLNISFLPTIQKEESEMQTYPHLGVKCFTFNFMHSHLFNDSKSWQPFVVMKKKLKC